MLRCEVQCPSRALAIWVPKSFLFLIDPSALEPLSLKVAHKQLYPNGPGGLLVHGQCHPSGGCLGDQGERLLQSPGTSELLKQEGPPPPPWPPAGPRSQDLGGSRNVPPGASRHWSGTQPASDSTGLEEVRPALRLAAGAWGSWDHAGHARCLVCPLPALEDEAGQRRKRRKGRMFPLQHLTTAPAQPSSGPPFPACSLAQSKQPNGTKLASLLLQLFVCASEKMGFSQ